MRYPANSWSWVANIVTFEYINPVLESLHNSWILLIKVPKDRETFEIVVVTSDRLEKILKI